MNFLLRFPAASRQHFFTLAHTKYFYRVESQLLKLILILVLLSVFWRQVATVKVSGCVRISPTIFIIAQCTYGRSTRCTAKPSVSPPGILLF